MKLYGSMGSRFGFLNWWPGDTKDEIFIGAILTQQTTWTNVEKAISNLKKSKALSVRALSRMETSIIEKLVRPSGYYRQKAKRLKLLSSTIMSEYGSLEGLFGLGQEALRKTLLGMKGIGPETADSIMLYAAGKPTFVIDAYTKRIMYRVFGTPANIDYDSLKEVFESALPKNPALYKDFHAQFVELGKSHCKTKPLCNHCPAFGLCKYAGQVPTGH
jgi:endonuclease-3 related protein